MAEHTIPLEAELTLFRNQLKNFKRRQEQRYRCGLATSGKLHFPANGACQTAWVCNLSVSGIALELPDELSAGREMVIVLRDHESNEVVRLPARVMHSTPVADGTWRVGCEFVERLSPELLESLL